MEETIFSAGIDIGTSTTQLIFSRLKMENTAGYGMTPKIEIISKEVVFKSRVHFTPLISDSEIDAEGVRRIIEHEYENAGFKPSDISTGAVIITGETSRKRNARAVCGAVSDFAGDFVAASAGPDLESLLAGKGSGCALLSEKSGMLTCNFDIGGGTTNICCFFNGEAVSTACLDIGGRLVRLDADRRVTYISNKLKLLISYHDIVLEKGELLTVQKATQICDVMAGVIFQSVGLRYQNEDLSLMQTNHGLDLPLMPEIFTFSGGVADCIYNDYDNPFEFGDIGVILGRVIKSSHEFNSIKTEKPLETMRATVIGAGNFCVELSGSTIEFSCCDFPYKNIPVLRLTLEGECCIDSLRNKAAEKIKAYLKSQEEACVFALSMKGIECPSYEQIERLADEFSSLLNQGFYKNAPLIIVTQSDMAKALGQAVRRKIPKGQPILCIDSIACYDGDYIDVGTPVMNAKAVPVAVKTLIFSE